MDTGLIDHKTPFTQDCLQYNMQTILPASGAKSFAMTETESKRVLNPAGKLIDAYISNLKVSREVFAVKKLKTNRQNLENFMHVGGTKNPKFLLDLAEIVAIDPKDLRAMAQGDARRVGNLVNITSRAPPALSTSEILAGLRARVSGMTDDERAQVAGLISGYIAAKIPSDRTAEAIHSMLDHGSTSSKHSKQNV